VSFEGFRRKLVHVLFFVVYYSGVLGATIRLRHRLWGEEAVVVLMYHRFMDGGSGGLLHRMGVKEFEKQILHVAKFYQLVELSDCFGGGSLGNCEKGTKVAVTIDDGYFCNYEMAWPVLKKLGVKPVIYLTTGLIGSQEGLWLDDVEMWLLMDQVHEICFPEVLGDGVYGVETIEEKREVLRRVYEMLLYVEHEKKKRLLEELRERLRVDVDAAHKRRKMLSWGEVQEMAIEGVEFGAHTVTHPTLTMMSVEGAKEEIRKSKEEVERRLEKGIVHFAIPNGKDEDFSEELEVYCRDIGFETIATTNYGVNGVSGDRFRLKRFGCEKGIHVFACRLEIEAFRATSGVKREDGSDMVRGVCDCEGERR